MALKGLVDLDVEYESDNVLAFHHTNPSYPVHIIVIPKKHIESFTTVTDKDIPILMEIMKVLKNLALGVEEQHGAAKVITNIGEYQDSKHLHFHVVSGTPF